LGEIKGAIWPINITSSYLSKVYNLFLKTSAEFQKMYLPLYLVCFRSIVYS